MRIHIGDSWLCNPCDKLYNKGARCPIHGNKVFTDLMAANVARQHLWNGTNPDGTPVTNGPLYAALELGGEVGELLNVVKKLERARLGRVGSRVDPEALPDELGDVMICVYLLASEHGLDPMQCAATKFNKTSRKLGFPIEMQIELRVTTAHKGDGEPD